MSEENKRVCILCGAISFSKGDNVCQKCIDEFGEIDRNTIPEDVIKLENAIFLRKWGPMLDEIEYYIDNNPRV